MIKHVTLGATLPRFTPLLSGYGGRWLDVAVDAGKKAAETMANAPELMTATEAGKKGGRGKKASNLLTLPTSSNDKNRLAARLKRDYPAIAARVANGEFKSIRGRVGKRD